MVLVHSILLYNWANKPIKQVNLHLLLSNNANMYGVVSDDLC